MKWRNPYVSQHPKAPILFYLPKLGILSKSPNPRIQKSSDSAISGFIGFLLNKVWGLYRGYKGTMENHMEALLRASGLSISSPRIVTQMERTWNMGYRVSQHWVGVPIFYEGPS